MKAEISILVAENDPLVRLGTIVMLRDLGYAPLTACDVPSARALVPQLEAQGILLTDYAMPGGTGVELARYVKKTAPQTKILIVTGHNHIDEPMDPEWIVLAKPFTCAELAHALGRTQAREK